MNESERQYEHQRLKMVLENIHLQISLGQKQFHNTRSGLQNALESFWETKTANFWDQAQQVETIIRERSITASSWRRQVSLKKMIDSPYFGRIDFLEELPVLTSMPEEIYIGIGSLNDPETGRNLIYDWRSPVAGMFYDFETGPANYLCPVGTISGIITLKRQYKIIAGEIRSMFDTDLKIDDEVLQEILGQSADSKMRTIVNSIQREQNRVIRDERHRLLLVQGPAGSGKTSIALHRVAYLLYQERETITSKNILILSPNQIFSDYISDVLPELGEENVLQTTFHDYISSQIRFSAKIEDRDTHMDYILSNPDSASYSARSAAIRYKSSPKFMTVIKNYLSFIEEELLRNSPTISFRGQVILSGEEWETLYRVNLAYLPPAERLAQIKQRVQVKLRPVIHELRLEKERAIAATGEEVNEKTIKAMARLAARDELEALEAKVDKFTTLIPLALYRKLFQDQTLISRLAPAGIPENWNQIRKFTLSWLNQGNIPYEDLLPLLFFQGIIEGFPVKSGIRRLIVDEAQDYTEFQYEILKRLFPGSSWTILGDPDQSVHPELQTMDFDRVADLLEIENSLSIKLQRSYRSTKEIQAFCHSLLQKNEPVEFINRSGRRPQMINISSPGVLPRIIEDSIRELQQDGNRSIAVICKNVSEAESIYQGLSAKTDISLINSEIEEFKRGIVIIPIYLAKGLEFDAVIIADAGSKRYHRKAERKLLYIACTRALHRLVLFYSQECSPFIKEVDKGLYEQGDPGRSLTARDRVVPRHPCSP